MSAVRTIKIAARVVWIATQTSAKPERWMGVCEELGISTEGETLDELHSLIPETIHLLMTDLVQDDELDAFLREKGWSHTADPVVPGNTEPNIVLPWQMTLEGDGGFQRSAS